MPDEVLPAEGTEDISDKVTVNGAWTTLFKKFVRQGNIVHFDFEGSCSTYQTAYMYTMLTIASGYRPKYTTVFLGHRTDGNYTPQGYHSVVVNTDGTIKVVANSTSGTYWFVSGWYEI